VIDSFVNWLSRRCYLAFEWKSFGFQQGLDDNRRDRLAKKMQACGSGSIFRTGEQQTQKTQENVLWF
jgi:hypothetical protein